MAIIVPVHAGLLRETHDEILVGFLFAFGTLDPEVMCPERVSEGKPRSLFAGLGSGNGLNLSSQRVEAFSLLSTSGYALVFLAHDLVLITSSFYWHCFPH